MSDLVIRNGTVITPGGSLRADIEVEDSLIARIQESMPGGKQEIDATGLTILPGLIDGHVHFNEPGRTDWEGAATGSRALAAGGGTLFIDMPLNSTPCTVNAANFALKRQALERSSIADFALWGGLIPGSVPHMAELAACGAVGFKAFMCNSGLPEFPAADDRTLYQGMREAARLGLPVAVHAESEPRLQAGGTSIREYLASRPVLAETEAIQRAALIAAETGARLHIVHVSSGSGVAAALEGRRQGVDITIETCPHYLYFTGDDLERIGACAKCAPPLRSNAERESLWTYLLNGDVDLIASDHSPAPPSLKTGDDFSAIWGGIAGVQSTLPVLLDASLDLQRIAHLTAAHPARHFRLANKGRIETGYHADLVLVDLNAAAELKFEHLFQKHALTPYLGASFRGVVRRTILRGQTIFNDGKITAQASGHFIHPHHA